MDYSRRKLIKLFSLGCALIFLSQCAPKAKTDQEFRDSSHNYTKREAVNRPLAEVSRVAQAYMVKCFKNFSTSYSGGISASSVNYDVKILKESDEGMSLAAFSADDEGFKNNKGYFTILLDLKAKSAHETEVAAYYRHRLLYQAFKLWLNEGSDVCPQGCGVF